MLFFFNICYIGLVHSTLIKKLRRDVDKIITEQKHTVKKHIDENNYKLWTCYCSCYSKHNYLEKNYTNIYVRDGKCFWYKSFVPIYVNSITDNYGVFAILSTGEIVGMPYDVKHCSITHDDNVVFAGEYIAKNGIIEYVNNFSGHYQTDPDSVDIAVRIFNLLGLHIDKTDRHKFN